MNHKSWLKPFLAAVVGISMFASAYGHNVNKDIDIDDGSETQGQSTVNGDISIGNDVIVSGSLETVNGKIDVGDNSKFRDVSVVNGRIRMGDGITAEDVSSVNGELHIGKSGTISGGVSAVNGKIEVGSGSTVAQDVGNVNGRIEIEGTEISGDLSTVTGNVLLTKNSLLRGDLIVEKPGGWSWNKKDSRKPRIVIGPGSKVLGKIVAEHEIELFVSDTAEIGGASGKVSMDQVVRFSGDRP